MKFDGEQFIPGQTSRRMEADHHERYKFASQFVMGKEVLDIACGAGYGSKLLKEAGAKHVDGVDLSPEVIQHAQTYFPADGVRFFVSDATSYIPNKKYDVIVSFETIEHVQDYHKLLSNFYHLLRGGGLLIVSTPNRMITSPSLQSLSDKPDYPFHMREFIMPELAEALRGCGFAVQGDYMFGQRQQIYFKNKYMRRLYKIIFNPDVNTSPAVAKLIKIPRYLIIKARKIP